MGESGAYVVTPVSSIQCPVFRIFAGNSDFIRSIIVKNKKIIFLFFFLNTEYWILSTASAHDFGVRGAIAPITEADPIVIIQNKLKTMEERGELKRHNLELQKKTRAAIERPKPVEGITNAQKDHVFYYDPTYAVKEDLKDHQGHIFYKKGTQINPLETVSLSQNLLFFDGDDVDQVAFAKEKLNQEKLSQDLPVKLILTKGAPLALSETWKVPVYFDQSGRLTQQLGIHHVPAVVTQESLRLRIEEINLNKEKNDLSKIKEGALK